MSTDNTTPRATREAVACVLDFLHICTETGSTCRRANVTKIGAPGHDGWECMDCGREMQTRPTLYELRAYILATPVAHPAPRGRVVKLLDKWNVVMKNGERVPFLDSFNSENEARERCAVEDRLWAPGAPHRVMRLALVDADAGEGVNDDTDWDYTHATPARAEGAGEVTEEMVSRAWKALESLHKVETHDESCHPPYQYPVPHINGVDYEDVRAALTAARNTEGA